jgi:DNA-binding Lrp family transcriptional regulator
MVVELATSYVLINVDIGSEREVLNALKQISEVKEAHSVYGEYDIVARLEADTMEEIKNAISWGVRRLEKVRSTVSMILV